MRRVGHRDSTVRFVAACSATFIDPFLIHFFASCEGKKVFASRCEAQLELQQP